MAPDFELGICYVKSQMPPQSIFSGKWKGLVTCAMKQKSQVHIGSVFALVLFSQPLIRICLPAVVSPNVGVGEAAGRREEMPISGFVG